MSLFYARSPKIIEYIGTAGDNVLIEVRVWNGSQGSAAPTAATYVRSKVIPNSVTNYVQFDISPFALEYMNRNPVIIPQSTQDTNNYCRVEVTIIVNEVQYSLTEYVAIEGYVTAGRDNENNGYRDPDSAGVINVPFGGSSLEWGVNPCLNSMREYYITDGDTNRIYIYNPTNALITFDYSDGTNTSTVSSTDEFIEMFMLNLSMGDEYTITVYDTLQLYITTFNITKVCEPKYTPIPVAFVNRFGVVEWITFFKKSTTSLETKKEEFTSFLSDLNRDTTRNYNFNASTKVKLNTGFVPERYSYAIEDLLLSKHVFLPNNVKVNVNTNNIEVFNHINDKLINYEIEFTHANTIID